MPKRDKPASSHDPAKAKPSPEADPRLDEELDKELAESFPASDPPSVVRRDEAPDRSRRG